MSSEISCAWASVAPNVSTELNARMMTEGFNKSTIGCTYIVGNNRRVPWFFLKGTGFSPYISYQPKTGFSP